MREPSYATHTPMQTQPMGMPRFRWNDAGIRTKMLVPLFVLMLLSLLGGIVGFILITNTTRSRVLHNQLELESGQVESKFKGVWKTTLDGAVVLSGYPELIQSIQTNDTTGSLAPSLERSIAVVQERFTLHQILILDAEGHLIYPEKSTTTFYQHTYFDTCSAPPYIPQRHLVKTDKKTWVAGCAPIWSSDESAAHNEPIGTVYTGVDTAHILSEMRSDLGSGTEIRFADDATLLPAFRDPDVFSPDTADTPSAPVSVAGYRVHHLAFNLDTSAQGSNTQHIALLLLHHEQQIQDTVNAGLRVMVISSTLTMLLLLAVGYWLSQGFTHPIQKLARVAQAVGSGDVSQRANLDYDDEIGQLGTALDNATSTIEDLLEQRARRAGELKAILQSLADGVLAIDTDEQIVLVNPVAATLLGQQPETLLQRPLSMLKDIEDPALSTGLHHIVDQIRSELSVPRTISIMPEERISLGERIVRLQSTPVFGSGDMLNGVVLVLQDITESVAAERSKSAFIGTASHEMRTPLSSMKGFVDILFLSGIDNLTEEQRMFLDTIKRQTNAMVQMVNDLLEVARLEQGGMRAEKAWVHVDQSLNEAIASLQQHIEKRQVELTIDLNDTVPPIWIDTMHMRRILTNIISNAVKYVHRGGHVHVRAYMLDDPSLLPSSPGEQPWKMREERSIVIEVEDDGVGIRERDQPKIFERFYRSENTLSVEAGGSGLGLAIAQSLVHLHHGQIGFWSVENKGSCFWIRFPASGTEALPEEH